MWTPSIVKSWVRLCSQLRYLVSDTIFTKTRAGSRFYKQPESDVRYIPLFSACVWWCCVQMTRRDSVWVPETTMTSTKRRTKSSSTFSTTAAFCRPAYSYPPVRRHWLSLVYLNPLVPNLGVNCWNWAMGPCDFGNWLFFFCNSVLTTTYCIGLKLAWEKQAHAAVALINDNRHIKINDYSLPFVPF